MINPESEERPWGNFTTFIKNQPCTVKILEVKPHSRLSLQYHLNREEFWQVMYGRGVIQIGDDVRILNGGDTAFVPKSVKHRIITGNDPLFILEISIGEFDENDIVRLQDDYKRVK